MSGDAKREKETVKIWKFLETQPGKCMGLNWTGALLGTQKTGEHFVFERKAEPNVLSADHFDFL